MISTIKKNASGAIYICALFFLSPAKLGQQLLQRGFSIIPEEIHSPCHMLIAFCMKLYLILQLKYLCVYLFQALQQQIVKQRTAESSWAVPSFCYLVLPCAIWQYRESHEFFFFFISHFDFDTHQLVTILCVWHWIDNFLPCEVWWYRNNLLIKTASTFIWKPEILWTLDHYIILNASHLFFFFIIYFETVFQISCWEPKYFIKMSPNYTE